MVNNYVPVLLVPVLLLLAVGAALSQNAEKLEEQNAANRRDYEVLKQQIVLSDEELKALEAEVAVIRKDNASLTAALIQAAKTEKKISRDINDIEGRLDTLRKRDFDIRTSLKLRQDLLAEVLAALQRMGLNPPPAILVKPEDALASVRSAILLGAVVPEMRVETEVLIADLKALTRITASITGERERLTERITEQIAEKERLSRLLQERRQLQEQSEGQMLAARRKADELVSKAADLEGLIASLETEIGSIRKAQEDARRAEEERLKREAELANRPVRNANKLPVAGPFGRLKGKLALPAAGELVARFGGEDGVGGRRTGDTVQTQSGAIVTAPADSIVLYSGPFRSYGQLLILDAGDGYHVVMAGMDRINAILGQSVLAGEPVGAMGEVRLASAVAQKTGNGNPELYIEFRKNGKPVNPDPWWAENRSGRTGNDS